MRQVTKDRFGLSPKLGRQAAAGAASLALSLAVFGCGGDSVEEPASPDAGHAAWGYSEADGPSKWASLEPDYEICGDGKRQSPIDIAGATPSGGADSTEVNYRPEKVAVENTGHEIEVNVEDPKSSVTVDGTEYGIERFHFHTPSEEKINDRRFDASIHLVNVGPDGKAAVIGLLVEEGPSNPVMDQVVPLIPDSKGDENEATDRIDPSRLLPDSDKVFEFKGSLTTPPCTEGIEWIVYKQPMTMSADQLDALRAAYSNNIRPIQPTNGRPISFTEVDSGGL